MFYYVNVILVYEIKLKINLLLTKKAQRQFATKFSIPYFNFNIKFVHTYIYK